MVGRHLPAASAHRPTAGATERYPPAQRMPVTEEPDPAEQYRMLLALVPAILFDPIDNDTLASLSPDEGVRAINFFTSHWREVHRIEMARAAVKAAYLGMRLIGSR